MGHPELALADFQAVLRFNPREAERYRALVKKAEAALEKPAK